ncbi:hypothetical protein K458DRAFT_247746, partial [Lentithecium fluviatile CBS 122367]
KPHFLGPTMWMYEILSLSAAGLILVAIATVLALYDQKPSPVVGGITPNTVVAFAATVFRICLMVPITNCCSEPEHSFQLGSALYTGLYSSGMVSLPNPPYSCPNGNCTWNTFPSLSVSV